MPRFMIERNFAEQLEFNRDAAAAVKQVNTDVGVQWLFSEFVKSAGAEYTWHL